MMKYITGYKQVCVLVKYLKCNSKTAEIMFAMEGLQFLSARNQDDLVCQDIFQCEVLLASFIEGTLPARYFFTSSFHRHKV